MLNEPVIAALISYVVMLFAFYMYRYRYVHIPLMISVMIFDLMMPFYLYSTRDWKTRLIDDGDILSFGLWAHFGLLITLFVLYFIQVAAGRRLVSGDQEIRQEHKTIAKGILLVRSLVIVSGILLIQAETTN